MLWHWDGKQKEDAMVKILLYLSDVSNRHGCMVALRHNKTGETFKVDGDKGSGAHFRPWGDAFTALPRIWLAELMQQGYQPSCLEGPAGTMIFFDVDIVHRGSRPAAGLHRDFVLWTATRRRRIRGVDRG